MLIAALWGTAAPANAANPDCPSGASNAERASIDYGGYTAAIVCFKPNGDVFYYQDTNGDGRAGGMYYVANDGQSHAHDKEYLWDTKGASKGWESLNTNEQENTIVRYRACLRAPGGASVEGCSLYVSRYA